MSLTISCSFNDDLFDLLECGAHVLDDQLFVEEDAEGKLFEDEDGFYGHRQFRPNNMLFVEMKM